MSTFSKSACVLGLLSSLSVALAVSAAVVEDKTRSAAKPPADGTVTEIKNAKAAKATPDIAPSVDRDAPTKAQRSGTMLRCYQHGRMIYESSASGAPVRGNKSTTIEVRKGRTLQLIDFNSAICIYERRG